jgi:hypothetical protein
MTCHHHASRAGPSGRCDSPLAVNAELLLTAAERTQDLTRLVASTRRLVQENHRLRQERRAIAAASPHPSRSTPGTPVVPIGNPSP